MELNPECNICEIEDSMGDRTITLINKNCKVHREYSIKYGIDRYSTSSRKGLYGHSSSISSSSSNSK